MSEAYVPLNNVRFAVDYMKKCPEQAKKCNKVFDISEEFINNYNGTLSGEEKLQAKMGCWNCKTVQQYLERFFSILTGYRHWEVSDEFVQKRLELIKKNNPEWEARFVSVHNWRNEVCRNNRKTKQIC